MIAQLLLRPGLGTRQSHPHVLGRVAMHFYVAAGSWTLWRVHVKSLLLALGSRTLWRVLLRLSTIADSTQWKFSLCYCSG